MGFIVFLPDTNNIKSIKGQLNVAPYVYLEKRYRKSIKPNIIVNYLFSDFRSIDNLVIGGVKRGSLNPPMIVLTSDLME